MQTRRARLSVLVSATVARIGVPKMKSKRHRRALARGIECRVNTVITLAGRLEIHGRTEHRYLQLVGKKILHAGTYYGQHDNIVYMYVCM